MIKAIKSIKHKMLILETEITNSQITVTVPSIGVFREIKKDKSS